MSVRGLLDTTDERISIFFSQNSELIRKYRFPNHEIGLNNYMFVYRLLSEFKIKTALDPYYNIFSPITYLNECIRHVYTVNNEIFDFLMENNNIKNCSLGTMKSVPSGVDSIVTFPPIMSNRDNIRNMEFCLQKLLADANSIHSVFYLTTTNNAYSRKTVDLYKEYKYPQTIIEFDSLLSIGTSVEMCLLVFNDENIRDVFQARISSDSKLDKYIIQNYHSRKSGKDTYKGYMSKPENLMPLKKIELNKIIQKKYNRIHLEEVKFEELLLDYKMISKIDEFELLENTIYIPEIVSKNIQSNIFNYETLPKKFYALQLDSNKVLSDYLKKFLVSKLGQQLLFSISSGAIMNRIALKDICNISIKLPSLNSQIEMLDIESLLTISRNMVDEIEYSLWNNLKIKNLKGYKRRLKSIIPDADDDKWIESLPFHVATTLWSYKTKNDNDKKNEALLYFFESFSELLCILILSFLKEDKEFYNLNKSVWLPKETQYQNWYEKTTFGQWNILLSKLQKFIRNLNEEERLKVFNEYDSDFIKVLMKKTLFEELEKCKNIRNKYKGHSGVKNIDVSRLTLNKLENCLNTIRSEVGFAFEDIRILAVSSVIPDEDLNDTTVHVLSGSRTTFKKEKIMLDSIMLKKNLYLHQFGTSKILKLLDFIRIDIVSGAAYFYLSVEDNKARWVSYHYSKKPENLSEIPLDLKLMFKI
jgi:hypothetical protein